MRNQEDKLQIYKQRLKKMAPQLAPKVAVFARNPVKLTKLMLAAEGEKILINGVPKAGTNLVKKLLIQLGMAESGVFFRLYGGISLRGVKRELFLFPKGSFITAHLFYDPEIKDYILKKNIKVILMVRDPRDVVLSNVSFTREIERPGLSPFCKLTEDEFIKACITGYSKTVPDLDENHNLQGGIAETYARILRWEKHGVGKVFFFEDLVGSKGGGSDTKQLESIRELADYVRVNLGESELKNTASNLFGGTNTYRSGQISKWKHKFSNEHKALFKIHTGDLLIKLGYEKDTMW